jgi:hypothetical protein
MKVPADRAHHRESKIPTSGKTGQKWGTLPDEKLSFAQALFGGDLVHGELLNWAKIGCLFGF